MFEREMGRRDFITAAALAGAAVASGSVLSGCAAEDGGDNATWDMEADVVVVGAGGTGVSAALEAADAGASVLVLEKADTWGGSSKLSGGVIQAAGTKYQQELAGISDDTPENHYQYWLQASEGLADTDLLRDLADGAAANVDWCAALGTEYVMIYGVSPIPYIDPKYMATRIHVPNKSTDPEVEGMRGGGTHVWNILKAATAKGVVLEYNSAVTELILDANNGVIGVVAEKEGTAVRVKANRGVVLATSGFDRNAEMATDFSPQQKWSQDTQHVLTAATNTGDGILMAMRIGAALAVVGGTISVPHENVAIAPLFPGLPEVPGIWVNTYGVRFVNEATHYAFAMRARFHQESHIAWSVFDAQTFAMGPIIGGNRVAWSEDMSEELESGLLVQADSLEELAETIGVPPTNLSATVARWNDDMTSTGTDSLFGKTYGLKAINTPPFYATEVKDGNLGACGGLKINVNAQVIDLDGNPIPRLYAGGMCTGGWIGAYYPGSGTAIQGTVHWGRRAGAGAAAETAWV